MTQELLDKLVEVAKCTSTEDQPFRVFALIRIPERYYGWEIVVAADWIEPDERNVVLRLVATEAQERLYPFSSTGIRRVNVTNMDSSVVRHIVRNYNVEFGTEEMTPAFIDDQLTDGYIIVARPRRPATWRHMTAGMALQPWPSATATH